MVSMWTFAVIFIAIFLVLLVFAVMWVVSERSGTAGEYLVSNHVEQQIPDRGALRVEASPDESAPPAAPRRAPRRGLATGARRAPRVHSNV